MRKVHVTVTLDVFVVADDDADITQRLSDSSFIVDPDNNACDETMEIQDVTVLTVGVTDSR